MGGCCLYDIINLVVLLLHTSLVATTTQDVLDYT